MIDEKSVVLQIFGGLLKNPSILGQTDKYILSLSDFSTSFEQRLFATIYNLYEKGAKNVSIVDIDNYLKDSPASYKIWEKEKGIEYLQDAEDLSDLNNFDYYYKKLKRINAIKALKKMGFNTSEFYDENLLNPDAEKINQNFENLTAKDIFDKVKLKISEAEKENGVSSGNTVSTASFGIHDLIKSLQLAPDTGGRLQGKYFNTIVRGARAGKFYLRSAASGTGKTRSMVGDACYLAYPIRYSNELMAWEWAGGCEKVLVIVTEQTLEEVQTMVLSYLTGINEEVILYGKYSSEQKKLIDQAIQIMDYYNNLNICTMASPNVEQMKYVIRDNALTQKIQYVFYDYIFSNPALLNEFRDLKIREDVALGLMSAALKDVAVEQDLFIMSATQLNANGEDNTRAIKNEAAIRGARSIVDKADMGCIMTRPTEEELNLVDVYAKSIGKTPNVVTDIYKMRRGRYTQVRIWSRNDLGTCRREDLFVTDSRLNLIDVDVLKQQYDEDSWNVTTNIELLNNGLPIGTESVSKIAKKIEEIDNHKNDLFFGLI